MNQTAMKISDPIGRVTNASAKMANDQSVPSSGDR